MDITGFYSQNLSGMWFLLAESSADKTKDWYLFSINAEEKVFRFQYLIQGRDYAGASFITLSVSGREFIRQ